jgi:hypothetical protein
MKKLSMLLALAAVAGMVATAGAVDNFNSTGVGEGVLVDPTDSQCGTLNMNADGSYENGYAWRYAGIQPPYYGAFAECYSGDVAVCSAVFDLTQVGSDFGQTMDVYVWNDGGGTPGSVACVRTGYDPSTIAFWPNLSRHVASLDNCCVTGSWWVGYWGNWPDQTNGWFIGADLDGFGGCPYTNIAPGIGYPTGWQNVSVVWGPTQAIGAGAETTDCGPSPVESSTWGAIKTLYN